MSKKKKMSDIAREAGVGLGTVSRVLNNDVHVSEKTRHKVLSIAQKYQYTPSAVAARLARNNDMDSTIGILLPDIGNHFYFEVFEGIYQLARRKGMNLLIFNYETHNERIIRNMLESGISVLLIFNFKLDTAELNLLKNRSIAHLYVNCPTREDECIYTDNVEGGRIAARYLVDKGVDHPCYIGDIDQSQSSLDRLQGFSEIMRQHGIFSFPVYTAKLNEESGRNVAKGILQKEKVDGIFCYCDEIAAGAVLEVRESHAPVRVIGFDGLQVSRQMRFSTVSQDPAGIANEVVSIVSWLVNGEGEKKVQKCIVPFLIDYDS